MLVCGPCIVLRTLFEQLSTLDIENAIFYELNLLENVLPNHLYLLSNQYPLDPLPKIIKLSGKLETDTTNSIQFYNPDTVYPQKLFIYTGEHNLDNLIQFSK